MPPTPQAGHPAPDFTLEGTDGTFRLSEHRGEVVVLLFYPGDGTPVCTKQFCSYRDRPDDFAALDATVVGISAKDVTSKQGFAADNHLTVPLLADEDRAVAKLYGAAAPLVGTRRAAVVIDAEGIVRHRHVHTLGLDFVGVDELRELVDAARGAPA
jgi:peroxiredoxin Q/BCP